MALTATDVQAVAKAVVNMPLKGGFTLGAIIVALKEELDGVQSSGDGDAAMQALVVAALQSSAGQAAIKAAVK